MRSITHGAISIVNAIPLGIGSTLGISLKVIIDVELSSSSKGVKILNTNTSLINAVINRIIPKSLLEEKCLVIKIYSEIPPGYGLKSSSAISNALSLALTRLLKDKIDDLEVINHAIEASFDAKVTITGAFDDATATYFGGFIVSDNYARKIIRHEECELLDVVILLPENVKRSDPLRLKTISNLFEEPVRLAKNGNYWEAMILNGVLTASILGIPYQPIREAMEEGAIAAGVSGNGPSIVAVTYNNKERIVKRLSNYGKVITAKTNNTKASVEVYEY